MTRPTSEPSQLALWPSALVVDADENSPCVLVGEPVPIAEAAQPPIPGRTPAQMIVGEWLDRCRARPPKRIVGQVAKLVRELLDEAIEPDAVRQGLASWMSRGQHPSTIPSFVNAALNAGGPDPHPVLRPSTADERVAQALAVAAMFAPPGPALGGARSPFALRAVPEPVDDDDDWSPWDSAATG